MKYKNVLILSLIAGALLTVTFGQDNVPTRESIAPEHTWNLGDIYPTIEDWEADYATLESRLSEFKNFEGKLKRSGKNILDCFTLDATLSQIHEDLYVYANLGSDMDTRNDNYQGLADRAGRITNLFQEATAFIEPELQAIPEKKLLKMISKTKGLEVYKQYFDNMIRQRAHSLSGPEERILAMAGDLYGASSKIHQAMTTTDMVFPMVKDEEGNEVRLTRGRYSRFLLSTDPEVRRGAFLGRTEAFDKIKNTNAATFDSYIKKDRFLSRVYKYESTLAMALDADNVPQSVFDNLIATTSKYSGSIHRYYNLRKKALGLDELHLYDTSVPIVADVDVMVPYAEAQETLLKAFAPMGDEYIATVKHGFESRWVDVFETEAKRTGAYSWGTYNSHPYVLMNYNGTQDHMFTLAHEFGHALHSYLSKMNQPYQTADYTLFAAEVASTFNEALLMDYLLKNTDNVDIKLMLLDKWINNFLGTVFTQVLFSEFERNAHQMVADGKPLTVASLNKTYHDLDVKWYGAAAVVDTGYALNWGRIPHFYRRFYVYKYATSFCASAALSKAVLAGEDGAIERYMEFLSSGGNDYPIEQLKKAGVDLSDPKTIEDAMELFDSLVTQMEELMAEKG